MPTVLCVTTTFAATHLQARLINLMEVEIKAEALTLRLTENESKQV